jgi:DNA-directed RNA polymerase specialized sigma24 family protein
MTSTARPEAHHRVFESRHTDTMSRLASAMLGDRARGAEMARETQLVAFAALQDGARIERDRLGTWLLELTARRVALAR